MIGAADEFGGGNCQPISNARMMPQFDDKVGGADLERYRRGEVGYFAEQ
jgi:hypothetical protein